MKYTLAEIQSIICDGFETEISPGVQENLEKIIAKIGIHCTVCIPSFPHKHVPGREEKAAAKEAWITQCKKNALCTDKSKIDEMLSIIRLNLNKLTVKTWDNILGKVHAVIDTVDEGDEETTDKISDLIINILSSSPFNSVVYSKMYIHLVKEYPWVGKNFETKYNLHVSSFDNLSYVSPDEDYDVFCAMNKQNEKRKAMGMFLVNIAELNYIPAIKVHQIIIRLMKKVVELSTQVGKTDIVDIISDNFVIAYTNKLTSNLQDEKMDLVDGEKSVLDYITLFATSKLKTYPSISSKSKFAYMKLIGR
jgi:hypothetical protein